MPYPQQDRNIAAPDAEVLYSIIRSWTTSALSPGQIAGLILQRINGTASTQSLLAAAIEALREQEARHAEAIDDLNRELSREISDLEDEIDALKIEVGNLRAKLQKATGTTP